MKESMIQTVKNIIDYPVLKHGVIKCHCEDFNKSFGPLCKYDEVFLESEFNKIALNLKSYHNIHCIRMNNYIYIVDMKVSKGLFEKHSKDYYKNDFLEILPFVIDLNNSSYSEKKDKNEEDECEGCKSCTRN